MRSLDLNGQWILSGFGPDGEHKQGLTATVPGHVHVDLARAGVILDPFWRDQADQCQWVEDWDWQYEREFDVPQEFALDWNVLEFSGLDTYATIELNGQEIAKTSNMFVPHRFDVTGKLKAGTNKLRVRFTSVKKATEGKPLDRYPAAFNTPERVHVRRMQCTFHWDWVNRFVSAGIWRPVTLYSYDRGYIDDVYVYTKSIGETSAAVAVRVEIDKKTSEPLKSRVEIKDPEGRTVWADTVAIRENTLRLTVDVPDAKLWWPNGSGEQPLYSCTVALIDSAGKELDSKQVTFGIRTIRIEQIQDRPGTPEHATTMAIRDSDPTDKSGDRPGSSFAVIVNGKRVFCKGGNWVPADPFPSTITPERYDRLIWLAKEANINLLRCWGGGIYEPDAFFDACDRYGVMVSQDFQMACANYPEDDPDFMDQLRKEFPLAIRSLRNHPSLAWWSGDNECGMHGDARDLDYPGRKIADEITGPLLHDLDPSRDFMLTSPYGGSPNNTRTVGDSHCSAAFDLATVSDEEFKAVDYRERINNLYARFISEYAVFSAPPMRSLLKFMTAEDIANPDTYMWEYRTKNNPYMSMTIHEMLQAVAQRLFGTSGSIDMQVRKMEYVGYELVRLAVENARRRKPYCNGIQFWMYNDCWPASGWSMVDYYGFPKAGYYAMRRTSKPVIASIEGCKDVYRIFVCNDQFVPASGELRVYVQPWTGGPVWETTKAFTVPEGVSQPVLEIDRKDLEQHLGLDTTLVCEIEGDFGSDRAFYYPGIPCEMDLPPATLTVEAIGNGTSGELKISTDNYARVVSIDVDLDLSDNYFDLLPGETKVVRWSVPHGTSVSAEGVPEISVTCWNAAR